MKISAPLVKALNKQIEMEANAANAYLSAASWCDIIQTEKIETCDHISQQSLINAILKLEKKF